MGFAVTKSGTFGVITRQYSGMYGQPCAVIRWGPLGWIIPVEMSDVYILKSYYESEARKEAELLLVPELNQDGNCR